MTSPAGNERPARRRRRRRAKPAPGPLAPAAVLADAQAPVLDAKREEPMTAAEVARMKTTLRFLRDHRQTLKLKVNAAEDLLLNGKREPTHRGLLQHLLSKLDRGRVISASERLPPAQATELLAGIVRFAPELPYVLRFLECVKASEHPKQAAAALTQALEQIDLSGSSLAQMRDLLQLVVDVFPATELPVFALSLLGRAAFRSAFDRSSEGLPERLAELLLPLRAFERWVAWRERRGPRRPRRGSERLSLERVREGAARMLGASEESLLALSEPLRRHIFELGRDGLGRVAAAVPTETSAAALVALFHSLDFHGAAARSEALLGLAAALLRSGLEARARALLHSAQAGLDDPRGARHWLSMLDGERLGDVVLEARGRRPRASGRARNGARQLTEPSAANASAPVAQAGEHELGEPEQAPHETEHAERWQRGWHVPTQREVLVRSAGAEGRDALVRHAELRARAFLPGVAPLVGQMLAASGTEARVWLTVAWMGPALARRLSEPELRVERALAWCEEACRLLAALAALGLELPEAAPVRFSVDAEDRLWLVDLWSVAESAPSDAARAHVEHARELCREILGALTLDVLPHAAASLLERASTFAELASALSAAR